MSTNSVSTGKSAVEFEDPQKKLVEFWLSSLPSERNRLFIDTETAAELVGISPRTIRFWIESGNIQAIRIGMKYHVCKKSLESFVINQSLQDQ